METSELPGNFPAGLLYFLEVGGSVGGGDEGNWKMLVCQEKRSADKYPFQLTFRFEQQNPTAKIKGIFIFLCFK